MKIRMRSRQVYGTVLLAKVNIAAIYIVAPVHIISCPGDPRLNPY